MKYGAKKGQKPKKPIKQKPVKALTGLEIALIGGAAGLAGAALAGGGKKAEAMPLNNPAAMVAPLSGFVGKKEEEQKTTGMKKGGLSGGKRYGAPPEKGPDSQGLKVMKAYLGKEVKQPTETDTEFGIRHEVHTPFKESDLYEKGSAFKGQKAIQVKKKAFRGIF